MSSGAWRLSLQHKLSSVKHQVAARQALGINDGQTARQDLIIDSPSPSSITYRPFYGGGESSERYMDHHRSSL